ncbi:hypothetical protein PB2503_03452 [Parvularcula bermudensis HTCC2503]|uniref:YCII-related domain-containing protein n=1 Tax=Parvularcula bermudensis (strain ATCC BAA-594 / HTCC2503 / KCTC 12087) TaxID=314260 RepID=E0TDL1_PARBH|nr:YciI family protein [Parvularcula bermudensis]ADM08766.1 hypothetical protein PB2503_03452 [Parvularcula bermudensis HTCC2503]
MTEKLYLCIQRSQPRPEGERAAPSPAQMEAMYARFNEWKEKFKDNIVDMGGQLLGGKVVTSDNVTDGPFVEAKDVVGGYMIVSAASLDEAVEVAQQSPGVGADGASVEVREISKP